MSRSKKKIPIHGICGVKREFHRLYKRKMVRRARRWLSSVDDVNDGNPFKKLEYDWRWRPDDGRVYDPNWAKSYRK
ncbi:MAG TPA: hypothetical protein VGO47_01675 [Chlamydiales bacterium]|jgi:hypothetical protein|nr:hypothetical protein [Chlamydiales bacterium]